MASSGQLERVVFNNLDLSQKAKSFAVASWCSSKIEKLWVVRPNIFKPKSRLSLFFYYNELISFCI